LWKDFYHLFLSELLLNFSFELFAYFIIRNECIILKFMVYFSGSAKWYFLAQHIFLFLMLFIYLYLIVPCLAWNCILRRLDQGLVTGKSSLERI
jgi:hypothetical protein